MKTNYSRQTSYLLCLFVYMAALAIALQFIYYFERSMDILWLILLSDILATLVVFGFSSTFKNSSLYDPYWSVAPPLMCFYWMQSGNNSLTGYCMLTVIAIWSIRLTYNWARGWRGLSHEDWRYKMLHDQNPKFYPITNLAGIHLFPTVMVFLGMLPVYFVTSVSHSYLNIPLLIVGLLISLFATAIQLIADEQMRNFKTHAKPDEFINSGLWKYSRHPNYFGEIMFWSGLWVTQMAVVPEYWWTAIGFVAMLIMFILASIPMMETKNRKTKVDYEMYSNRVSILIPWPPKKQ